MQTGAGVVEYLVGQLVLTHGTKSEVMRDPLVIAAAIGAAGGPFDLSALQPGAERLAAARRTDAFSSSRHSTGQPSMPLFRVSVAAQDGTMLWTCGVSAGSPSDAKREALRIMREGGGVRSQVGHPPPGPFSVKVTKAADERTMR